MRIAQALILLVAAGVVFTFARYFAHARHGGILLPMRIGSTELSVTLADTPIKHARGLSGQAGIGENEGMLFVFDRADAYAFWMKDMRFPIDILWIGEGSDGSSDKAVTKKDRVVVGITPNIQPDSFPERFIPSTPVRYVLEVNAGWAERHGVRTGTPVALPEIVD